jgi:hypothetical protein
MQADSQHRIDEKPALRGGIRAHFNGLTGASVYGDCFVGLRIACNLLSDGR